MRIFDVGSQEKLQIYFLNITSGFSIAPGVIGQGLDLLSAPRCSISAESSLGGAAVAGIAYGIYNAYITISKAEKMVSQIKYELFILFNLAADELKNEDKTVDDALKHAQTNQETNPLSSYHQALKNILYNYESLADNDDYQVMQFIFEYKKRRDLTENAPEKRLWSKWKRMKIADKDAFLYNNLNDDKEHLDSEYAYRIAAAKKLVGVMRMNYAALLIDNANEMKNTDNQLLLETLKNKLDTLDHDQLSEFFSNKAVYQQILQFMKYLNTLYKNKTSADIYRSLVQFCQLIDTIIEYKNKVDGWKKIDPMRLMQSNSPIGLSFAKFIESNELEANMGQGPAVEIGHKTVLLSAALALGLYSTGQCIATTIISFGVISVLSPFAVGLIIAGLALLITTVSMYCNQRIKQMEAQREGVFEMLKTNRKTAAEAVNAITRHGLIKKAMKTPDLSPQLNHRYANMVADHPNTFFSSTQRQSPSDSPTHSSNDVPANMSVARQVA